MQVCAASMPISRLVSTCSSLLCKYQDSISLSEEEQPVPLLEHLTPHNLVKYSSTTNIKTLYQRSSMILCRNGQGQWSECFHRELHFNMYSTAPADTPSLNICNVCRNAQNTASRKKILAKIRPRRSTYSCCTYILYKRYNQQQP